MGEDWSGDGEESSRPNRATSDEYKIPVGGAELKSIISTVDDAIFIFAVERTGGDVSFRFQWNNPAHESITGMTIDEFAGQRPREFLGEEVGARVAANYRRCVERRETVEYEETLEHENGQVRWHTKLVPVIKDDEVVQIIGMARDITDLMARTKHIQVVDRVFRHNIRNTLNAVQLRAQNIEAETEPPIADDATRILKLLDDLLHTSEKARTITEVIIEQSQRTRLRVDSVTEQTAAVVSEKFPGADISITAPQSGTVLASPRLTEAVVELVENAVVHHDQPSPSVEVVVAPNEEVVDLKVTDDGPGIPETEREILVGGRAPMELSHGTGLGIWMVYWIVRQSGGEVMVGDRSPRGSVVTIRLPRTTEEGDGTRR